jgi:hypothetical protein
MMTQMGRQQGRLTLIELGSGPLNEFQQHEFQMLSRSRSAFLHTIIDILGHSCQVFRQNPVREILFVIRVRDANRLCRVFVSQ